jgi:outer membrane protein OmpA-like peptidoglycan-associated protein
MIMKKLLACLLVCLFFLPSCRRDKNSSQKTIKIERDKKKNDRGRRNLFLEDDVQEFTFEEEAGTDAFASGFMKDDSSVKLVDSVDQSDRAVGSHRASQAQYGFKSLYFGYDRFSINGDQKAGLEHNLAAVKKAVNAGSTVVVEGHSCSSAGSAVYNMLLSEKRAQAVAKYLVDNGVSVDNIKVVGRGSEMCIVPVGDRHQQAPNRRVELYVV